MIAKLVGFVVILVLMGIWYLFQDTSKVVNAVAVQGTVSEINENAMVVKLESGGTATVAKPVPLTPRVGSQVPLRIETQESGRKRAYFDHNAWMEQN